MNRGGLKPVDDRKIVERVLKGDAEAFNLLVRRWEKPIYNFIVRMIGDREEAMDLCQDAFMKAYRELGTLKDLDRFSSWLYRIAHNTCFSKLRKDSGKTFLEFEPETHGWERPSRTGLPWKRLSSICPRISARLWC